jgi:hypothetical protein
MPDIDQKRNRQAIAKIRPAGYNPKEPGEGNHGISCRKPAEAGLQNGAKTAERSGRNGTGLIYFHPVSKN